MKKLIFIQGGSDGGYEADLKLVESLRHIPGRKIEIKYPKILPDLTQPDYGWVRQIDHELAQCTDGFILTGHSFGASMILKWMSEHQVGIRLQGVYLLATPYWSGEEEWKQGLILKDDFAEHLPAGLPFYFYHCSDDEEVSPSQMDQYRRKFPEATYRLLDQGGHQFNNDLAFMVRDLP